MKKEDEIYRLGKKKVSSFLFLRMHPRHADALEHAHSHTSIEIA